MLLNENWHCVEVESKGPDDIAASVFESLWKRADKQTFGDEDLLTSDDLWRLLSKMIRFKTENASRRNAAQKRGGGVLRGESVFDGIDGEGMGIDNNQGVSLTPDELIQLEEGYTELMEKLDDDVLQKIAVMRIENYKVAEIAGEFNKSERWVKRKLALMRGIWQGEIDKTD